MAERRGTAIGFVLVTAVSLLFSVSAGMKGATILKDIPLAQTRKLPNDFKLPPVLVMPPRNFPPSRLAFFFIAAPVGISLSAGFAFASLWQSRNVPVFIKALFVVCFCILLALSAVNFGLNPDRDVDTAIEVWLSGTMMLAGFLVVILNIQAAKRETDTDYGFFGMILLLFQGVLLPSSVAIVMGIDTLTTQEILINGWGGVTVGTFFASLFLAALMLKPKLLKKQQPRLT